MSDDDQTQDQSENTTPESASTIATPVGGVEDLPDRLRVHSLARVLGTTSRKVLDTLRDLDGRSRSAHSSVDRTVAVRVRDVLTAAESPAEPGSDAPDETAPQVPDTENLVPADTMVIIGLDVEAEPESRLMLEAPETIPASATADYLPLFVAPQPIETRPEPTPSADGVGDTADDDTDEDSVDDDVDDAGDAGDGDDGDDGEDSDEDGADRPANRRRRRGRRGRGRGRGSDGEAGETPEGAPSGESEDSTAKPASDEDTDADADAVGDDTDEESGGDASSRRRRRRRRRKSGSSEDADSASSDDPPNTVVHERAPRAKSGKGSDPDEIQGISGSTRLEAKRQRRRDGRDAGRRRPPILSEAEFLARREAVERVMVVRDKVRNESPHEGAHYTQIAVLEDGVLVEHFVTSAASASLVGNIYLGIVQNVLPSMEAAFVDIGRGRNGVLYAGEVNWEAAGLGGSNRKIEQALKPGDYVVVQVSKDPVGHKGARLTTQVSLAGRYLVYVPGASSTGISRKLPDTERQRLKEILREVVPADAGVIIRTASEGVKEDDIRSDVTRLQEHWNQIEAKAVETKQKAAGAAVALYEEPDVLLKVIRDLFNEDFSNLIVSGDGAWETINTYVNEVAPELVSKLTQYEASSPSGAPGPDVFAVHRIDEQLAKAMDRKAWLPSGGTLVIDRTEAMTVVDVNTGKFTGAGGNLEQTVTKNNLEAAEEIVRQLRLRDIGGIIVIDFIDMVLESNRDLVLRRLTEALARDRTRHQVSEVTSLGLVQLTRKRLGTGLIEAFSTTCSQCAGRGIVLHADPIDSGSASASAPARKSESGGRRGRRGKKGRSDESGPAEVPVVAKVPPHAAGEHPMFKAMAAANGQHEDDEVAAPADDDELTVSVAAGIPAAEGGEPLGDDGDTGEESDDVDLDDVDEDLDEDSDVDLEDDDDDEDEDEDDDIEDLDDLDLAEDDEDSEDEDSDDEDDSDLEDEDSDDEDEDEDDAEDDEDSDDAEDSAGAVLTTARPRRRRAAARPAGPPR